MTASLAPLLPVLSGLMRLLAVAALAFAPMAPTHAADGAAPGGASVAPIWIEICADGAVAYLRIDEEGRGVPAGADGGSAPGSGCVCDFCVCGVIHAGAGALPGSVACLLLPRLPARVASMPVAEADVPAGVERFWSISRGPPDHQEKKQMNDIFPNRAVPDELSAFGPGRGGAPWV